MPVVMPQLSPVQKPSPAPKKVVQSKSCYDLCSHIALVLFWGGSGETSIFARRLRESGVRDTARRGQISPLRRERQRGEFGRGGVGGIGAVAWFS